MDTKQDFFNVIYNHYTEKVGKRISPELLRGLSEKITDHYFEQYSGFKVQYPKSAKRYSTFKMDDLNHPNVTEMVINYFRQKAGDKYADYATIVLECSVNDLNKFEKNREDYYNK